MATPITPTTPGGPATLSGLRTQLLLFAATHRLWACWYAYGGVICYRVAAQATAEGCVVALDGPHDRPGPPGCRRVVFEIQGCCGSDTLVLDLPERPFLEYNCGTLPPAAAEAYFARSSVLSRAWHTVGEGPVEVEASYVPAIAAPGTAQVLIRHAVASDPAHVSSTTGKKVTVYPCLGGWSPLLLTVAADALPTLGRCLERLWFVIQRALLKIETELAGELRVYIKNQADPEAFLGAHVAAPYSVALDSEGPAGPAVRLARGAAQLGGVLDVGFGFEGMTFWVRRGLCQLRDAAGVGLLGS